MCSFVEIFQKSNLSFLDAGHSEQMAYVYATAVFLWRGSDHDGMCNVITVGSCLGDLIIMLKESHCTILDSVMIHRLLTCW